MGLVISRRTILLVTPPVAFLALIVGCGAREQAAHAPAEAEPRVHAPPGPTWRARCAAMMERTRAELSTTIPALAGASVHVTRNPETIVRMNARLPGGAYYEVIVSEPSPNSDFDSDIKEVAWEDVRTRMRPIPAPVLALSRLHQDRRAYIAADRVRPELADALALRMRPVAEECLRLAEHVASFDHYFVGAVTSVTPWSGATAADAGATGGIFQVDDAPSALVTMRIEQADKDTPFAKGTIQRFAVADGAAFREPAFAQPRSYWLRADTEEGKTTFALARTISMIDDNDRCPDAPARDGGVDEDGCP